MSSISPKGPPKKVTIRPAAAPEERDKTVMRWAAVIDKVDFLTLLRLPKTERGPSEPDVRRAYRAFARAFHPDHYRDATPEIRSAAAKIFSVGAEAYHVLMDPLLRLRYLRALAAGHVRVPIEDLERSTRDAANKAASLPSVSLAKTPGGKQHADRADKMLALGELTHAKTALEKALEHEPGNVGLAAKLQAVEARLYAPRKGG